MLNKYAEDTHGYNPQNKSAIALTRIILYELNVCRVKKQIKLHSTDALKQLRRKQHLLHFLLPPKWNGASPCEIFLLYSFFLQILLEFLLCILVAFCFLHFCLINKCFSELNGFQTFK